MNEVEREAREEGWVPQDEWKGPPEKWVDAETFIKRGETILPIVNAKLRKSNETVEKLTRDVEELREGNKAFREFHEQVLARQKKDHEAELTQLKADRAKAITDGDGQAFIRTEERMRELERPAAQEVPAEVQAWIADNPWYNDPALSAIANGLSDLLAREKPKLKGRPFLDELTERVKKEVPHRFENPRRTESVTDEGRQQSVSKTRGYNDLPADAKAACDRFVKTIPGFKREDYVANYQWSE